MGLVARTCQRAWSTLERMRTLILVITGCVGLLLCDPAFALRCGNKLIREGLHEQEVLRLCGQPATRKELGYRLVPYVGRNVRPALGKRYGYSGRFMEEVRVSELVYNFGPDKLQRRLVFEDALLVRIDTLGYGYRDTRNKRLTALPGGDTLPPPRQEPPE